MAVLQAGIRTVTRQLAGRAGQLALPQRQFPDPRLCLIGQAGGPGLIGAGFGLRRLHRLGVELLQVFEQHPPRHAVHHQVVNHQQQALAVIGHVHQQRPQQRAVVQVQAALGLFAQGFEFVS